MIKINNVGLKAKSSFTFRQEGRQKLLTCENLRPLESRKWIISKENTTWPY